MQPHENEIRAALGRVVVSGHLNKSPQLVSFLRFVVEETLASRGSRIKAVKDKVHLHDIHATLLALMGMDHERLTYFHQGRDTRLTDVFGNDGIATVNVEVK